MKARRSSSKSMFSKKHDVVRPIGDLERRNLTRGYGVCRRELAGVVTVYRLFAGSMLERLRERERGQMHT